MGAYMVSKASLSKQKKHTSDNDKTCLASESVEIKRGSFCFLFLIELRRQIVLELAPHPQARTYEVVEQVLDHRRIGFALEHNLFGRRNELRHTWVFNERYKRSDPRYGAKYIYSAKAER